MESNGDLASALRDTGQLIEAEILGRRVLEYQQQNPESFSQRTGMLMYDLIATLRMLGRLEEAERMERPLRFSC